MLTFKYILKLFVIITFIEFIYCADSDINQKKKSRSKKKNDKNVLNVDQFIKDALDTNFPNDIKNFSGITLGYVTPWNGLGYDIAKKYTQKLSIISPVWFQLEYDGNTFSINGQHDIDNGWLTQLRSNNPETKLVPRLIFERWSRSNFQYVVQNEYKMSELTQQLLDFVENKDFDGLVLEMWMQIGISSLDNTAELLEHLSYRFKSANKLIIFVAPPSVNNRNQNNGFGSYEFERLHPFIDYLSLMTYDYSSGTYGGPNSPVDWIKYCVDSLTNDISVRSKILLGMNFYGYLYCPDQIKPILGHEFIDLLKNAKQVEMKFDDESNEYKFITRSKEGTQCTVWYPTLKSIQLRLQLVENLKTGVAIWELGQGLNYFYSKL